ncbi:MAG: hypothetical protein R3A12_17210 [Ignavibacteria bacterium]
MEPPGCESQRQTNGGSTWTDKGIPGFNNVISNGQFADANTGFCYSGSNVWKSTNGGTNWNLLSTRPADIQFSSLKVFSNSTLFSSTGRGIFKSFNSGLTWDSSIRSGD